MLLPTSPESKPAALSHDSTSKDVSLWQFVSWSTTRGTQPIASPHQDAAEPTCHEEAAPAGARFVDDVAVVDAVAVAGEAADGVFRGILDVELAGAQQLAAQTPLVGEDPGGIRPQDAAAHGDAPTLALPYLQEGGLYGGGVCGRQERRVGASWAN